MEYSSKFNTGLMANMALDRGKFSLVGGTQKVEDNLRFFLSFDGWFRTYLEDYPPNFLALTQRPLSYIKEFKTLILGTTYFKIKEYLPHLTVDKMDFVVSAQDRKEISIGLVYRYNLNPKESIVTIKEIKI